MTNECRKRGRPKGATRYHNQDEQILVQAARRLYRREAQNVTHAFRLCGAKTDSEIRRLRNKWNKNRAYFEAEAERLETTPKRSAVRVSAGFHDLSNVNITAIREATNIVWKAAEPVARSDLFKVAKELRNRSRIMSDLQRQLRDHRKLLKLR